MYYLLLILLYPVSLLPLWILYRFSDLAFVILYHITGYRKEVVSSNLAHAFPEKADEERAIILRRFYRSFCDQWIETLKLLSMPERQLKRRMIGNWEVLQKLAVEGRNTYLLTGHTYNWEWANAAVAIHAPQAYACVYLPLTSKGFDQLMLRIRERTGTIMVSMKSLKSGFKKIQGIQYILGLAADQNPSVVEVAEWIPFMNREAPFFRGPEQMPRRAKAAVVLIGIRKLKRGYYEATLERIADDASVTAPGEILQHYVSFIENQLRRQPENYLWSHKRWKHVRKKKD